MARQNIETTDTLDEGRDKINDNFIENYASIASNASALSGKEASANKDATGGYAGLTLFKINFKNALNSFTSFFTNANTAARTYTFQDRDGTIADDRDIVDAATPSTSGGTITLDFASKRQRIFNGSASFTGSKTLALSNATNALAFTFNFQVTGGGAALTFPTGDFKSSDSRFVANVLTITGAGYYEVTCVYDAVSDIWKLKAEIDGGVV